MSSFQILCSCDVFTEFNMAESKMVAMSELHVVEYQMAAMSELRQLILCWRSLYD